MNTALFFALAALTGSLAQMDPHHVVQRQLKSYSCDAYGTDSGGGNSSGLVAGIVMVCLVASAFAGTLLYFLYEFAFAAYRENNDEDETQSKDSTDIFTLRRRAISTLLELSTKSR